MLVLGGVGLLCVIAIVAGLGSLFGLGGLGSLFGLGGPTSTTAADYTSAEVREIINILKLDDETRHGLLIPGSSAKRERISLDLWEAVLGKPDVVARYRQYGKMWTYQTKDGSVAVPIIMWRELGAEDVGMPWLFTGGAEFSVALGDKSVDRAALKQRILAIKRRVDKSLPKNPYEGKSPDEIRKIVSKEYDEQKRKERDRQHKADAKWQAEMDRASQERETVTKINRKADADFHDHVRDYYRFGTPERDSLSKQSNDWIERRVTALTKAWKSGKDWKNVPLPTKEAVSAAISDGKPIPVVGVGASDATTAQKQTPPPPRPAEPQSTADAGTSTKHSERKPKPSPSTDVSSGPPQPKNGAGSKPEKAVVKGNFAAWTVPSDPQSGQNYHIVIEVKVPDGVTKLPRSDISGTIVGSDGYKQDLPGVRRGYLPVKNGRAKLTVLVPGGTNLVKDTISVKSKLLGKSAKLVIGF